MKQGGGPQGFLHPAEDAKRIGQIPQPQSGLALPGATAFC
ncbi:rCG59133 [Rattus norvegicus]|uniref:RCG59133 n=1 Tax=Rattus norvegicus TaxID=10116 RepID=A6KU09_RAT|nr:rCG59133 [Rattus norvegicus]